MRPYSNLILRVGVAFAFLYPPFAALRDPVSWFAYFPAFMRGLAPELVLLHGFGLLEVIIALWILSGKRIFLPASAAVLILCAIVSFDFADFDVVFRDLAIAAAAAALAVDALPSKSREGVY